MTEPVSVGLVGAGPWASMVHAPVLAASPHTRLAGVWARRPEPVTDVHAHGDLHAWVGLALEHEGGAVSEASMCATSPLQPHRAGVELYGSKGVLELDCATAVGADAFATLASELATMVRTGDGH